MIGTAMTMSMQWLGVAEISFATQDVTVRTVWEDRESKPTVIRSCRVRIGRYLASFRCLVAARSGL